MEDIDLCISIGGDSSYLKAAGMIYNSKIPLLGINSDPRRRTGALCNLGMLYDSREKMIPKIYEDLYCGQYSTFYRTRALFRHLNPITKVETQKLCLNEVFAAEKNVAVTSIYKVSADDKDMGKFKSSGILISTGTGSSGWLYSSKQIRYSDVRQIKQLLGKNLDVNDEEVSYLFLFQALCSSTSQG